MNSSPLEHPLCSQVGPAPEQRANYHMAKLFEAAFLEIRRIAWYDAPQGASDAQRLSHIGELADLFHCIPQILKSCQCDAGFFDSIIASAERYQSTHERAAPYQKLLKQAIESSLHLKNSQGSLGPCSREQQPV